MPPSRPRRSYDQYCALARSLDLVGDRWTLLIVRELLAGPRRYTDLHADLPGVSTDMLATRLKDMERDGLTTRRRLSPPGAVHVYELTPRGRELLPVLTVLGSWGAPGLAERRPTDAVRAHWAALPLRGRLAGIVADLDAGPAPALDPDMDPDPDAAGAGAGGVREGGAVVIDVRLDEGVFHVRFDGSGECAVPDGAEAAPPYGEGAAEAADAGLEMDADVCARVADGSLPLGRGVREGAVRVTGAGPVADALRGAGMPADAAGTHRNDGGRRPGGPAADPGHILSCEGQVG